MARVGLVPSHKQWWPRFVLVIKVLSVTVLGGAPQHQVTGEDHSQPNQPRANPSPWAPLVGILWHLVSLGRLRKGVPGLFLHSRVLIKG